MNQFILLFVFLFSTNLFAQAPTYVPKNGLMGWWGFNGNAKDESGNENQGLEYNTVLIEDRFKKLNQAVKLNGKDSYVRIEKSLKLTNSYTISSWFRTTSTMTNEIGLVVSRKDYSHSDGLYLFNSNQYFQCVSKCGGDFKYNVLVKDFNDGEWHHFVSVYTGKEMIGYVDGERYGITEYQAEICIDSVFEFGRDHPFGRYFNGDIDEIGIWNRPLTENEVSHLYSGIILNGNLSLQDKVKIGNQIWTKKNLDVDKFRNGDAIPQAKSQEDLSKADSLKLPVWYFPEFDPELGFKFGKLYNWYAVTDSKGLTPNGWHIPSRNEWFELIDFSKSFIVRDSSRSYYYGDSISSIDSLIYTPTREAYIFQSKTGGWNIGYESEGDEVIDPNSINGMDTTGFSATSGGSYWWSSSEVSKGSDRAWGFDLGDGLSCDNSIESELGRNQNFITGYNQELRTSVLGKEYINSDGTLNKTKYKELYNSLIPTAGTPKGEGHYVRCIKD
jgi:uncharacterized protein (TIGR02145 family)